MDNALRALGIVTGPLDARAEYLKGIREKYSHTLRLNSRFVRNVSVGFRVRPTTPHVRYKPYTTKERYRTRSETGDGDSNLRSPMDEQEEIEDTSSDLSQLKKAKSLESIVAENDSGANVNNIALSIQNLRVVE